MALRLLCVLAHPDDESLALGGTLARYGAEGVETYLVTATRGEHGWMGDAAKRIVFLASPYARFPEEIRKDTDILEITRTWTFTREDQVSAE